MRFVHYTYPDSTSRTPHFEVNAFLDDGTWLGHYPRRGGWLENVFVAPDQRSKGVCALLVRHAINRKRGLRLHVRDTNTAARRCYTRAGFQPVSNHNGMIVMKHVSDIQPK